MHISYPAGAPAPAAIERSSTRAGFFLFGLFLSAWAPLAPLAKQRLHLADGPFGFALLCFGLGSIIAMPIGTAITSRAGCRRVMLFAVPLACACLPVLATTDNSIVLAMTLFIFGAGLGATEAAMNLQAAWVQRRSAEPLMSGFHALFSVGCIAGSSGVSVFLWSGWTPLRSISVIGAVVALVLARYGRHFHTDKSHERAPSFVLPHGRVLVVGVLCFITFLAEGAMLDWSGVFLATVKGLAPAHSGWGYATFAVAMTVGRLTGDRLTRTFGAASLLCTGALAAVVGLTLSVVIPGWVIAVPGFALIGFGLANVVPLLYLAIARQKTVALAVAMPAVATIGYAGMLAGPAIVGSIAQYTDLPIAIGCIAALLLVVAANARIVR